VLTDSHCHLDGPKLAPQLAAVLERARAAGVTRVLTVSSEAGDFERVVATAESAREGLDGAWAAVGVHPHEAARLDAGMLGRVRAAAASPTVIAIGEIGLDYHYDHSPRDAQQQAFRDQLRLARELSLPVVVHSREAEDDTERILREEDAASLGGVLHCFTSERRLADAAVELGLLVSFSGIVTFPSAAGLRETVRALPLSSLLVETDAPYLAPIPHRGRTCEPAFVRRTAELLAELRGLSLQELAAATSANFDRVFLRS
jgi:TatD DNase family protein